MQMSADSWPCQGSAHLARMSYPNIQTEKVWAIHTEMCNCRGNKSCFVNLWKGAPGFQRNCLAPSGVEKYQAWHCSVIWFIHYISAFMSSTMLATFDFWFFADLEVHFSILSTVSKSLESISNHCISDVSWHVPDLLHLPTRWCKKWSLKSSTCQRMLRQKRKMWTGHKTRCLSE